MAALTQSATEGLLSRLTKILQDEANLIGGVPRDMKFIKDEMDSMNGFLRHLNKMESEHDDQVRAWMKQVREIAYVADDCVERYVRDMRLHGIDRGGCLGYAAMAYLFLLKPTTFWQIHKLGKQITELKARVHEVGERRMRYDVKVPAGRDRRLVQTEASDQGEERRDAFVRRLLEEELHEDEKKARTQAAQAPGLLPGSSLLLKMGGLLLAVVPSAVLRPSSDAIAQLPRPVVSSEAATIRSILKRCFQQGGSGGLSEAKAFRCTKKMFLCALYVYPYPTNAELKKLKEGVEVPGVTSKEARDQVMVFCYSMLSNQEKSCLQYLMAFLCETEISRTSIVRRWVAEGLVGKEPGVAGGTTPEEAGERCFRELLLRGFIRAARCSHTGTVKSCLMDGPVKDFVDGITKTDNFLADLPAHIQRQVDIRKIVQSHSFMPPPAPASASGSAALRNMLVSCCCGGGGGGCTWFEDDEYASSAAHGMDKLMDYIKTLPKLYRLNVLDLGGCKGLRRHHLESFAEVDCLKYFSLRKTDAPSLRATACYGRSKLCWMNKLTMLETLDIRGTNIPPGDTKKLYLPQLKHLLAGRFVATATTTNTGRTLSAEKAMLDTVYMPDRIGSMRHMETLSYVQVSIDGAELQGVAKLQQLRKLGVVVHANTDTAAGLGRVLFVLAGCLRSLSVWVVDVVDPVAQTKATGKGGGEGILDISSRHEIASSLALQNLGIKGKMSLPSWIGRAPKLANVTLRDTEMDGGDALRRLAAVASLSCLTLSRKAFTEQALRFKDVQFQALRVLVVEGDAFARVTFFAVDAAPKLEKIAWTIGGGSTIAQTHSEELIVGIQHLPSLKEIELRARFKVENLLDWTRQQTTSSNPRYRIRYKSSTDTDQLFAELPKAATDTTLTLPAGVIN